MPAVRGHIVDKLVLAVATGLLILCLYLSVLAKRIGEVGKGGLELLCAAPGLAGMGFVDNDCEMLARVLDFLEDHGELLKC